MAPSCSTLRLQRQAERKHRMDDAQLAIDCLQGAKETSLDETAMAATANADPRSTSMKHRRPAERERPTEVKHTSTRCTRTHCSLVNSHMKKNQVYNGTLGLDHDMLDCAVKRKHCSGRTQSVRSQCGLINTMCIPNSSWIECI